MIKPGIFKANDIRGRAQGPDPDWDADGAYAIGAAYADTLAAAGERALVLGHDMRLTSPALSAAFAQGALSRGTAVTDIGLSSTDQLWFASGHLGLPGAMFTASHNPAADNGIKFCLSGARPVTGDLLTEVARRALDPRESAPAPGPPGRLTHRDLLGEYAGYLHRLVGLADIRRLRVVADAGNGMAGHTLPAVLSGQNIDLIGLYTDLDGTFPNHPPNPLQPENLLDARQAVRDHSADLALVFDGDADRCFIIDERGTPVSPSAITAMIAAQELRREQGGTIVINAITSRSVPATVAALGGRTVITRVGHTFVKAAMAEHDAIFGGEHSAHYYFRDFWGADTGMLAALHVLALVGRSDQPLSRLAADFSSYVASGEINSKVADPTQVINQLRRRFAGRGEVDEMDGLTISGAEWWLNVRPSNTEPLLRLNVEAPTAAQMESLRDEALTVIRG